jgi:hypothetical protein
MQAPDDLALFARVFIGSCGAVMFLHFTAMAGYTGRGPLIRFVLFPTLAGLGLFTMLAGILGHVDAGIIGLALSVAPLLTLYMVVWGMGGHVSKVFEDRARERDLQRARHYYREAQAGVDMVAEGLVTDSGLIALREAEARAAQQPRPDNRTEARA